MGSTKNNNTRLNKNKTNQRDLEFIKDYVDYAKTIEVEFPKDFQKDVVEFSRELKEKEKNFIVEVSPRMIIGLIRLAKAAARLALRNKVDTKDRDKAKKIIKKRLNIKNR